MFELPDIDRIVAMALAEDLGVEPERFGVTAAPCPDVLARDVTTASVMDLDSRYAGVIVARQACTVCGLGVASAVFERLSRAAGLLEPVELFPLVAEGTRVKPGTAVAEVEGVTASILTAERTALDFLMFLSGIATETARWVEAAGPGLLVCDTRKTLPGLRALSKYAVRVGGGANHRFGLFDLVLVKDNHLARIGSVSQAVARARAAHPDLELEVEADSAAQAVEAVRAGADMVLLDNMDDTLLAKVVRLCRTAAEERGRPVMLEASGGVTIERLAGLRQAGVDRVSTSALALAPPCDFGLDDA